MVNFRKRSRDAGNDGPAAYAKTSRKFSIVQKTFLLALVVQICAAGSLKAQTWLTYGNGQDGNLPVTSANQPVYTNDVVYPVVEYSKPSSGSPPYYITITINGSDAYSGTGAWDPTTGCHLHFSDSDRVLIVDLGVSHNTTTRNYDLGTVTATAYSSGVTTLTVRAAGTILGSMYIANGNPKTLTQIMKVHQWQNISFASTTDTITCHGYDSTLGIGGILAFDCSNITDMDTNGIISASGKGPIGVEAHARGVVGTQGGSIGNGGSAMAGNGTSATGSPLGNPYPASGGITIEATCAGNPSLIAGGNGGCGAGAFDGTGPFPPQIQHLFPAPNESNLVMGFNAGYSGLTGQGGGSGGDGGGGGGGLVAGTNGTIPIQAVGYGGKGGIGGNGGGLIYLKIYELKADSVHRPHVILSTGTQGTDGEPGSYTTHGDGGDGGNGGNGGCSVTTYYAPGGGGSGGQGGNGSDGGGGGYGGPGGDVWLSAYVLTYLDSSLVNNNGGAGTPSTSGTMQSMNGSLGADGSTSSICTTMCGIGCTYSYISKFDAAVYCDGNAGCSDSGAFAVLALMQTNTGDVYTNPTSGDPRNYAVWDATSMTLTAYSWNPGSGGTCTAPASGGTYNIYYAQLPCAATFAFWGAITGAATYGGGIYTWTGAGNYNTTTSTLTDQATGHTCTPNSCPGGGGDTSCVRPCPGKPGPAGPAGAAGNKTMPSSSTPTTGGSDPSSPMIVRQNNLINGTNGGTQLMVGSGINPVGVTDYKMAVMPNPSAGNATIKFTAPGNADFNLSVCDITGKEIHRKLISATQGENTYIIPAQNFGAGEYIISLESNGAVQKVKFIKQ